jgi:queuine tRNA-ribosyltransferase
MGIKFEILHQDTGSQARLGLIRTFYGTISTPVFMPIGSVGSVKTLSPLELEALGTEIILANAYHLYLRPGHEVIAELGGLHRFMSWDHSILTDSGGYQVFSLGELCRVTEEGATFQSHLDGSLHFFSPEVSIEIQEALGADIMMTLDECLPYPTSYEDAKESLVRTSLWARRCREAHHRTNQALFGIVQGSFYPDLRFEATEKLLRIGFDGYAIGGLSVGETQEMMLRVIEQIVPVLPREAPRYLMGVGTPEDLLECVIRGVDMFDCVMPTRHARTGCLFTSTGRLIIKNAQYIKDERPIEPGCPCYACQHFSRAYLRHLFMAKETLALRLNTIHNLYYYLSFMGELREAIRHGRLLKFREEFYRQRCDLKESRMERTEAEDDL